MKKFAFLMYSVVLSTIPTAVYASGSSKINTGDTAFMLFATVLVMLMTPGLAFFYGGMVRKKNFLATIMQSFTAMAIVSLQWILIGYTLAFGPDKGHLIGGMKWFLLSNVGMEPNVSYAPTIPHVVFVLFQMMFAIITPALIAGSYAERVKFPAFILFTFLWSTLVYDPVAHWIWGNGGWLKQLGIMDFAGGTVIHVASGVSGLVAALYIGKRKNYGKEPMVPHNIPMVALGTGLLWFGWFGFNGGSALQANAVAANAFLTTNTAAAAGAVAWMIVEWRHQGKPTLFGLLSGAVAGLATITQASGYVTVAAALLIGFIAGAVCYYTVTVLKNRLGYDDSLDAFGIHGIGGTMGAIATGLFATVKVNPAGYNGLFYGNPKQLAIQLLGVVSVYAFAVVMTLFILKVVDLLTGLRVQEEEEEIGLDLSLHGEDAYSYLNGFVDEVVLNTVDADNYVIKKEKMSTAWSENMS